METEKQMWEKELYERKKFVELTKGFEEFMQQTKDQTHRIELMAHGELDVDGEEKLLKKSHSARAMKLASKFTRNLLTADAEEQDMVFHQAFQTLGLKTGNIQDKNFTVNLDPNEVIKKCVQQNDIKNNLEGKRASFEASIAKIRGAIEEGAQNIQNQTLFGRDITTNRMLEETELRLFSKRKELDKIKEKIFFLQKILNPVQTGIQILGKRLTHNDGNNLSTLQFGDLLHKRLLEIMAENPEGEDHHGHSGQHFNHKGVSTSPAHSPSKAAKAALENKDLFVSPNNLRVRSRNWSLDMEQDLHRDDERKVKSKSRSLSISKTDEAPKIMDVKDRNAVKKDSSHLVRSTIRAQNRTPKRKKKGVVFNRLYGSKV
jgi:hypothetical protein